MMGERDLLIVSSAEKAVDTLRTALLPLGLAGAEHAGSGAEARRALLAGEWRLVVINAPLSDEFGHELAVLAAEKTGAGIVLITRAGQAESAAARVEDAGVFVVAANSRIMALQSQNRALARQIEDIRLVDRAKCALIQYQQLTEPAAHRYIEQRAMDTRRPRREIAREILAVYEREE